MDARSNLVVIALSSFALLALSSLSVSARIVCNVEGECWHAHSDYDYRPDWGLAIHPDDWYWKEGERFVWREHEGRGYWHGGRWREF